MATTLDTHVSNPRHQKVQIPTKHNSLLPPKPTGQKSILRATDNTLAKTQQSYNLKTESTISANSEGITEYIQNYTTSKLLPDDSNPTIMRNLSNLKEKIYPSKYVIEFMDCLEKLYIIKTAIQSLTIDNNPMLTQVKGHLKFLTKVFDTPKKKKLYCGLYSEFEIIINSNKKFVYD